jgi:GNAT superfamily N-acetyltransferase
VVLSQAPHYRDIIATTESLFVEKKMRVTGAGLALIRAAEEVALHKGCNALFVSAPAGGQLEKLMPKLKYRESHKVFARVL